MRRTPAALMLTTTLAGLGCSGLFTVRSREVEAQDLAAILEIDELIREQGLDRALAAEKEPVDLRAGMDILDGWRVTYDFKGEKVRIYHEIATYLNLDDAISSYEGDRESLGMAAVFSGKHEVPLKGTLAWGEESACKHYVDDDANVTGLTCHARKGQRYFLFEVQGIDPEAAGGIDGLLGDRLVALDAWVPEGLESGIEVDPRR